MRVKYHTFFGLERIVEMEQMPFGTDNLVIVPATDTKRIEHARVALTARNAFKNRDELEDKVALRELSSMVIGLRPVSIPPKPVVVASTEQKVTTRVPPKRQPPRKPLQK